MINKYNNSEVTIRHAKKEDMNAVAEMTQELADFERMSDRPELNVKDLQSDGFESNPPAFHCLVAELNSDGKIIGYALYFPTYSSWKGRCMMLQNLYVKASERRRGIGQRLFNAVAHKASSIGSQLDFHVLEWNDARSFYEKIGAVNLTNKEKWCYYRLTGEALRQVALIEKLL